MKRSGSTIKEKGKSEKQTRKTKQHGKTADDPQIPQPDLRFASGSKSKQHKTGPGPTPNKTNDLPHDTEGITHRVTKTCTNRN